jgi:hypothetical protein
MVPRVLESKKKFCLVQPFLANFFALLQKITNLHETLGNYWRRSFDPIVAKFSASVIGYHVDTILKDLCSSSKTEVTRITSKMDPEKKYCRKRKIKKNQFKM